MAKQARELFVIHVGRAQPDLVKACDNRLTALQHLEERQELPRGDVLRPDVVAGILVDQWLDVQMTRDVWALVQDALSPVQYFPIQV